MNRLDEPVFMAVSKPMQTEFGIHHRLESCAYLIDFLEPLSDCGIELRLVTLFLEKRRHPVVILDLHRWRRTLRWGLAEVRGTRGLGLVFHKNNKVIFVQSRQMCSLN